ncbi:MAG: hypothetical protein V4596_06530 [Bdellovibrionota bacterium]
MELHNLKLNRTIIPFSKFKVDGFTPREEFQKKAYSILEDIIGKMPSDATFSAECKKRFGKYYFNITVNGSNTHFEASTTVDPSEEDSKDRNWLNKAIEGLHNSMNIQIDDWLQSRRLT